MPDGDPRSTVHTRINPKAVHKLCNILFVMRGENMKKRILIGIVSFFTAIVCAISIAASDSVFKDVKPNSWYHDDVVKAYERGLIKGMTDDTFAHPVSLRELSISRFFRACTVRRLILKTHSPMYLQTHGMFSMSDGQSRLE